MDTVFRKFLFLPPQSEAALDWAHRLRARYPQIAIATPETPEEALAEIADAQGCFGFLGKELLKAAGKLRWLQAPFAAPPAGYYYQELIEHPLVVTNFREIYNDHITAHVIGVVLSFARGLDQYAVCQSRAEWKPSAGRAPVHLPEATALIAGLGGIGRETARLLGAFGARVLATDARSLELSEGVAEVHAPDHLEALLPQADFVIVTVPHTPQTEGMFGGKQFGLMKKSAFFINVGRGMTTMLDDLVSALSSGEIAGAALDVFEQEPLPADHPLWHMPGVILTPHVAWRGPYLDERRYEIIEDNFEAMLQRSPMRNLVDKKTWF